MPDDLPMLPSDEDSLHGTRDWPHAPPHRLKAAGVYFLTARAWQKRPLLAAEPMRDWFQETLFTLVK